MSSAFDTAGFYAAIDAVRKERGVTWNHVFRKTFVNNCVSAQKRTHTPEPAARQVLAAWAGIDASAYEREAVRP